jgi:hypothetical protein
MTWGFKVVDIVPTTFCETICIDVWDEDGELVNDLSWLLDDKGSQDEDCWDI